MSNSNDSATVDRRDLVITIAELIGAATAAAGGFMIHTGLGVLVIGVLVLVAAVVAA